MGDTRIFALCLVAACTHPAPVPPAPPPKTLAVLLPESDAYPQAATAVSTSLRTAQVAGIEKTDVSKVTLEVVQLQIECIDATPQCYAAAGKSLAANKLLFASIAPGSPKNKKQVLVTVTLFDVDGGAVVKTAQKLFPKQTDVAAGADGLVQEVTAP